MFEDEYIELAQGRAYWQARAEAAENDLRELRENTLLALGHNRPALEDIMKLQHPPNGHRLKQELAAAIARAEAAETQLAAFAPGQWLNVRRVDPDAEDEQAAIGEMNDERAYLQL